MAELERQLGRGDLPPDERARLEDELRELRRAIDATQAGREQQQDLLATTPMSFSYGSGEFAPRSGPPSLRDSLRRSLDGFVAGVGILLIVLVTLLPWALLAALIWWAVRLVLRRRPGGSSAGRRRSGRRRENLRRLIRAHHLGLREQPVAEGGDLALAAPALRIDQPMGAVGDVDMREGLDQPARGQLGAPEHRRHHRDARAGDRRIGLHHLIVQDQPRIGRSPRGATL